MPSILPHLSACLVLLPGPLHTLEIKGEAATQSSVYDCNHRVLPIGREAGATDRYWRPAVLCLVALRRLALKRPKRDRLSIAVTSGRRHFHNDCLTGSQPVTESVLFNQNTGGNAVRLVSR